MVAGTCSPYGGVTASGSSPLTFTAATGAASASSDLSILWDFDNDGDYDEAVEDITSYVLTAETVTGRDFPSSLTGKSGPGKLRLTLRNEDGRFNRSNGDSPLTQDPFSLKSGRRIRVQTNDGVLGSSLITYVGIGAAAVASNASVSPALPTGLVEGDLLLVVASIRNSGTGTVATLTGWSDLFTSGNVTVLGRYYTAGVTAPTVTFSGGVANATTIAQCMAFRGTHQTLSRVVSLSQAQLNGSAQDIAYPALVVAENDNAVVGIGWKQDDWTSVAQLSGFTEISDSPTTTGDDAGIVIDYKIQTTAATISSGNFTVTGGASAISRGLMLALRPAVDIGDPVLLARDRFTRAQDSASLGVDELGTAWASTLNGGFGARGGTACVPTGVNASYGVSIAASLDVGVTDMYVQGSIPMLVQDGRVGLIARLLDSSNYVRCYYSAADRGVKIEEVVAGVVTNLGVFSIEAWDGMTLGLGVVNQTVTAYVGGTPLEFTSPLQLTRAATGTRAGLYGRWETHSDVPPRVDDFYVWDRVRSDIDGVLWTGTVRKITSSVVAGDLRVATVEAEGPLSDAATIEVPAPRIVRSIGEHDNGTNHSVPAGCIVGDIMARAGTLHPPHPLPTNPLSNLGPHSAKDGRALGLARDVELAELGFLRETQEGGVAFEDRDYRDDLSSLAWFSDTTGTGQFFYSTIEPLDEQNQIVNRAIARVAPSAPTVVSVENQGDDSVSLDVSIVMPTVSVGQLVVVFISSSAQADGVRWGESSPWVNHRDVGDQHGMRVYSLICDGTETGTTYYFYKGSTQGTYLAHIYVIDNWYGTDDGLKLGRVTSGAVNGTDAYPVSPGWNRAPALYIVFQCTIGAVTGTLWGPLDTPPPVGYNYDSLEGLVFVTAPVAYETGVESVYKVDVTDTEDPRAWNDVFADYLLLETVVLAVRGYDGPLGKPTIDNPKATGGQGLFVAVDDDDSQIDHQLVRSNQEVPVLHYTEADARSWCEEVVERYGTDRPIITISFYASKSAALREQAMRRRVSDRITVTATGSNSNLGIEGDFFIEATHHRFSHGTTLWLCSWELSPAG